MIVFTIIGVLFFWTCCWHVGYFVAMYFDATAKWDLFMKPYVSELETFVGSMEVILKRREV